MNLNLENWLFCECEFHNRELQPHAPHRHTFAIRICVASVQSVKIYFVSLRYKQGNGEQKPYLELGRRIGVTPKIAPW